VVWTKQRKRGLDNILVRHSIKQICHARMLVAEIMDNACCARGHDFLLALLNGSTSMYANGMYTMSMIELIEEDLNVTIKLEDSGLFIYEHWPT